MTDTPDEQPLEDLQRTIDDARRQAEADGLLDDPSTPPERTFADPEGDGTADPAKRAPG